eukprot:608298-Alexandrium_andersonii.AAC.1
MTCFDQIDRRILSAVLRHVGFPERIVGPWCAMMAQLRTVNTLAEGVGEPYMRECSIPQGCA